MNAKQEAEKLMNAMLPLAERMLRQHREVYPYGGYMKLDGTIVDVGADDPETYHPKSGDLIYVLRSSLREIAGSKRCKAAAILFDAVIDLPESGHRGDAIQVCLEHVDGYSAEVFFPYQLINHDLVYGRTFAQEGKREIFVDD